MFEDIARNLLVPHERGMVTTLVVPQEGARDHRDPWETARQRPPHVDFVTDDLDGFCCRWRPRKAGNNPARKGCKPRPDGLHGCRAGHPGAMRGRLHGSAPTARP